MSYLQSKSIPNTAYPSARKNSPVVLIVDDEPYAKDRLQLALQTDGELNDVTLLQATRLGEALEILSTTPSHVVLLDKNLELGPGKAENGIEGIPEMLRVQPHLQILVLTGSHDIPDVVRAMNLGAFNYFTKETPDQILISQVDRAIHVALLKLEKERRERNQSPGSIQLGGRSKVFLDTLRLAESMSASNRPILILGETGTGKTELAQWIHQQRSRFLKLRDASFFPVNVSTLSRNLIESELFGHEKGAFTDASQLKRGLFEVANNGTLFLDEIGEFPLDLQSKLLTVIEKGTFMRAGGTQTLHSNAKLIFATNRRLEKMVKEGTFREDLYMRISLLTIQMPSLKERKEDIPDIVRAMLPRACDENRVARIEFGELPEDFVEHLTHSNLQGNLRGVQHQLERLLVFAPRDKSGRPVLTRWKSVPGLNVEIQNRDHSGTSSNQTPISYEELRSRPWNLISKGFPGMNSMLEEIKTGLLQEASTKFSSRREAASALGMLENTFSMLVRRYPDLEKILKKRGRGYPPNQEKEPL